LGAQLRTTKEKTMKYWPRLAAAGLLLGIALVNLSSAGPISAEEARRQAQVLERLSKAVGAETTDAGKLAQIARVMKDERDANFRRRLLEMALRIPGADLEPFLTDVLTRDEDAGLRSQAATALGRSGSEKCLTTLARAAAKDRTTAAVIGDVGGEGSARRAATFALAELAARFPRIADDAAAALRDLPAVEDAKDNQGLADARVQALYQITRDNALLKPFYQRLKSSDAKDRERGVVAFRFLKLKAAPTELVNTLKDSSPEVRSWSALVLGEIGDRKTADVLLQVAGDTKEQAGVRSNAICSLGHMKVAAAADALEKLLTDPEPSVRTNAAIALYRITGKKVKQLPEGFKDD
jgi:HEAT repeat protein